jgi:hypothetical protein
VSDGALFTFSPTQEATDPVPTVTADMILRDGNNRYYKIYDLGNNAVLGASGLGHVGTEWAFMRLGDFSGANSTDMILRDGNTGVFEVYDISTTHHRGRIEGTGRVGVADRRL